MNQHVINNTKLLGNCPKWQKVDMMSELTKICPKWQKYVNFFVNFHMLIRTLFPYSAFPRPFPVWNHYKVIEVEVIFESALFPPWQSIHYFFRPIILRCLLWLLYICCNVWLALVNDWWGVYICNCVQESTSLHCKNLSPFTCHL